MGHHTRSRTAATLIVTLLALAQASSAGAANAPADPSVADHRGIRVVSADQAERRMAACMRSAPLSADHHERHALACVVRVSSGRL